MKIGDKVIVEFAGGHTKKLSVATIHGETKRCWRVNSSLFYKTTLEERGGGDWFRSRLKPYNEEDAKKIRQKELRKEIRRRMGLEDYYTYSLVKLEKMYELLLSDEV